MDLEYYRNFITIVEAGSISAAAKKISIAQPALSNQLKQLQRHYDAKLIEVRRGGHRMELTDAGRVLLRKARLICDEEESASKEIADCRAGFSGTLRFSLSPSMSLWLITRYLTKFNKLYPDVNYELHECSPAEQVEELQSGKAEFCVTNGGPRLSSRQMRIIFSRKERLMAFYKENSVFLRDDNPNMSLDELDGMPVCLSQGSGMYFLSVCRDSKVHVRILSMSTTKLSAMNWAKADAGIVVVPSEMEEEVPQGLVRKSIVDERMFQRKTLYVLKDRPLSTVGKKFQEFFLQEVDLLEDIDDLENV
ncbi:MAG: LysR family transcriptional regulator [Succiniclasticum sp.]|jgi:LysR family transcriptional regulator, salicylic acid-responsive activator of bsdBCD